MTFKQRVKDLLGIAKPGGLDDLIVRAAKLAVAAFLAQPFVPVLRELDFASFDISLARAAAQAGAVAFVGTLVNAALIALAKFSQS